MIGPRVAQIHLVRAACVIARVVERAHQFRQPFVDRRLRHAFVAPAPHHNRRMMPVAQNRVARVLQEQRRIFGFQVVGLRRFPEIVPHHQSVLVGQRVEALFRVLAHPVADHVHVRVAMQAEVRLQVCRADALQHVVHAPVAAARGNAHAVHFDHQVRSRPSATRLAGSTPILQPQAPASAPSYAVGSHASTPGVAGASPGSVSSCRSVECLHAFRRSAAAPRRACGWAEPPRVAGVPMRRRARSRSSPPSSQIQFVSARSSSHPWRTKPSVCAARDRRSHSATTAADSEP